MIVKEKKEVRPFIGILLFVISIVLFITTCPIGLLYGLLHTTIRKSVKGLGEYTLKIAISIDQLGNVVMQHILNLLLIKKGGYKFGNRDETISSAIGKNIQLETLSGFGKFIDRMLNFIDPDHSLNSIDYFIEPVEKAYK
ncbi:hypothetical protein [Sinomicrobium weinanense]|uniref:Uncharacterized protein n=1 Tax=Sinomicrobium weinanense TaxID=2842200 RepID=A0A926Q2N6_9FLAO|nr:hypothetical protein [Sinomicrobium weinanense]MBC9796822.1 hypothetical protein [Sinomicrobium weinanense]MBU3123674.1 hypothetical protein [Sinomicrobium weinanense]